MLHISALSRVGLSQEDVERFRDQLSRVLEHFETLAELDTKGIPATAQVGQLQNVMRSDDPAPSTPREDILANAPLTEEGYFKIRAVLEE
ncbi:MAG: Asp-tRNA(Asn)/Glu-tRNA(Gln) amidotransferase subunit GatC [Dehalococcoidia bacterium]|nr:Asp-tRNA(Asn)/Glu-tRNA(Gln) amidotransferase subunit GatC [Dehalococcoidia bacterium]